MPFGEHQVDHSEHRVQPPRQVLRQRYRQRNPRLSDLALSPDYALRHGRLGHHERGGYLRGGQAAHRPERKRHPDLGVERRMAAGEDERQLVIAYRPVRTRQPGVGRLDSGLSLAHYPERVAAHDVDRLMPGCRDQPGARVTRHACGWPLHNGGSTRLLHSVLSDLDVADPAGDRGNGRPPVVANNGVKALVAIHAGAATWMTGRISIEPSDALGSVAAHFS